MIIDLGYHLGHVFQKLSVRSRTELAATWPALHNHPSFPRCDRTCETDRIGDSAVSRARDRLAPADGPHEMLTLLEES